MRRSGFTLLELSIVLVIIGLIIGGVTVGAELIRQAQLQSVAKDFQKYQTALQTFKLKYRYYPGDLPNAYGYWPGSGNNNQPCPSGLGVNGNGDGKISSRNWINNGEDSRAWQQLGLAGLIEGSLTGVYTASGIKWNTNAPESRISGAGYILSSDTTQDGTCALNTSGRTGNYVRLVSKGNVHGLTGDAGNMGAGGAISAEEAFNIDTKLDDGLAQSGIVQATNPTSPYTYCINGTTNYYLDSAESHACRVSYYID